MKLIPTLPCAYQRDRHQVLSLYTMYLAQEYGMQYRTIASGTITRHLLAVAAISDAYKLFDPRLDSQGNASPCIAKVIHEVT